MIVGSDTPVTGHVYAFELDGGALRWKRAFARGVAVDLHRQGETVLAATMTGDVTALDLADGEVAWWEASPSGGGEAPAQGLALDPTLDGDRYVVPWRSGHLEAYDAATGERLWRSELPATPNSSVVSVDGALALGTIDGRLLRLDPATGEVLRELRVGSVVYGELVPAEDCLLALAAPDDGFDGPGHAVVCASLDLIGVRWHHVTEGNEIGTFEPLVSGDEVIVGGEGALVGLALRDGAQRWTHPVRGLARGLALNRASDGSTLYLGTLGGTVIALPCRSGAAGRDH